MSDYCIVLITAPHHQEAKSLAKGLVESCLAACVNIIPQIESIYRWEGEIQEEQECLLICKTRISCWASLQEWVLENHSYTVPEILNVPITSGFSGYLDWLKASTSK
jgi:periplasmic divalent cation tolerance protein